MLNKQKVKSFRGDFEKAVAQLEKDYAPIKSSKDDFNVGDVVFIMHKKIDPIKTFEIIKINNKNIKVRDRDNNQMINVSPSLLKK